METVPLQLPDGTVSPVRLFAPERERHADPIVVVMFPGLGVPAGYYDKFAAALAEHGYAAVIGELRGQGDSRPRPSSDSTFGYHELVSVDLPAIFEVARERFPEATPYLLGHSIGGQLGALYAARARGRLGGLILVASGTPYYRGFPGATSPKLLVASGVMSITASLTGYWPGDRVNFGGFGRQSKKLITDWARLARTGKFRPAGADIDYEERLTRLKLPVLAITVEADQLAPPESTAHLLSKLPNVQLTRWHQEEPLGHNGWIRNCDTTVGRVVEWLGER